MHDVGIPEQLTAVLTARRCAAVADGWKRQLWWASCPLAVARRGFDRAPLSSHARDPAVHERQRRLSLEVTVGGALVGASVAGETGKQPVLQRSLLCAKGDPGMTKSLRNGVLLLLLSVGMVTSSCSPSQTNQLSTIATVGTVIITDIPCVLHMVSDLFTLKDGERLTLSDVLDLGSECMPAALDTYLVFAASGSQANIPQVDIQHELDGNRNVVEHTLSPTTTTSNAIANCDPANPLPVTLSFTVPFVMFVGDQNQLGDQGTTTTLDQATVERLGRQPTSAAWTDAQVIAQQLYLRDNIGQYLTPVDAPSASLPERIPPRTKESFKLTLTVQYRIGGALVSRNGNPGQAYAWLYEDGVSFGDPVPVQTPVTASDCPS